MRYIGILSLALSAALLLLGCGPKDSSTSPSDQKIANAKQKVGEAEKATAEAALAKRDDYARDVHKQLDECDAKCKQLEARIAKAEGQVKMDLE